MLAAAMWSVLAISVLAVMAVFGSMAVHLLRASETPAFWMAPLIGCAYVLMFPAGACGLLLTTVLDDRSPARVVVTAIAILLLAGAVLCTAQVIRQGWLTRRQNRRSKRILSRTEVLALIRSGEVERFAKRQESLQMFLKPDPTGKDMVRTRRADPRDYSECVAAANDVRDQVGVIHYHNSDNPLDPSSPGGRWITPEEAAELLNAGEIKTFSFGNPEASFIGPGEHGQITFHGIPTGIKLADYGWVRHISVTPAMEPTMIPIARAAQARHGIPQFSINGHNE
ncbi:hypothetical protein SAMN04489729_7976 [Amycolatopsis lurida]|uniref:Uncharacterized protein n=1 Tax=Amycolatopsis lurida NRRL 2430 TaxID=1460371 RepID=A0A2P2FU55_AMYLU|nr:hypothetical protein [Amycolatopsis lurida]KFU80277.1 hypothetical protein BB31_15745 [Amycolatopsis lurida NRRL 2430]SEE54177.1 hypothetical protein SAMN04489729_7976 [Amycolatopsis lurida]